MRVDAIEANNITYTNDRNTKCRNRCIALVDTGGGEAKGGWEKRDPDRKLTELPCATFCVVDRIKIGLRVTHNFYVRRYATPPTPALVLPRASSSFERLRRGGAGPPRKCGARRSAASTTTTSPWASILAACGAVAGSR